MESSVAINSEGFEVVETRLRAMGLNDLQRRSRPTHQLLVGLPDGEPITIEVKAKSRPMPGGGQGKLSIDWWLKDQSDADLVAAVELTSERIWLFRIGEFRELAQQHTPADESHLYMWVDPAVEPRNGYARNLDSDFDDFLLQNRLGLLGPNAREEDRDDRWSSDELAAAVRAYAIMLQHDRDGLPYSKADWNERLREESLARRTKSSVEYRMQNVSAVLDEMGLVWIKGYAPAGNVGSNVSLAIQRELAANGVFHGTVFETTYDEGVLDQRVDEILEGPGLPIPPGTREPKSRSTETVVYERDAGVKAWVLRHADGICELCGDPGPFIDRKGRRYLELHHVQPLSEGGSDEVENAAGLCPNCHRHVHSGEDAEARTAQLYSQVPRLVR